MEPCSGLQALQKYVKSWKLELQKMLNRALESVAVPSDYLKTRRLEFRTMQSGAMEPLVGLKMSKYFKNT